MTAVFWDASNWDNYFWSGLLSVAAPVGKHVPFTGNIELIKSYQLAFTSSSQRLRVVNPISAFTAMETRSVTERREMRLRLCERLVYVLIVSIPHNVQNWWLCQFWNGETSHGQTEGAHVYETGGFCKRKKKTSGFREQISFLTFSLSVLGWGKPRLCIHEAKLSTHHVGSWDGEVIVTHCPPSPVVENLYAALVVFLLVPRET